METERGIFLFVASIYLVKLFQTKISTSTPCRPSTNDDAKGTPPIRVWMDGVFDLMHYGHMNAFRLAKGENAYLIVGVNSQESVTKCKGSPVRYISVCICDYG
jgi:cytidyltransferase-like protein